MVKCEPITDTEENFYSLTTENNTFKTPESQLQKRKKIDDFSQEDGPEEEYQFFKKSLSKDEMSIYGVYVANEISKMQPRTQTIVKHLINNILFDGGMGKYDEHSTTEQYANLTFPLSAFTPTQAGPSNSSTVQISKRKGAAEL